MADQPINAHLQDCILRLAIENEDFIKLVRPVLDPSMLTSRIPAELYQLCVSYYDIYQRPPADHFHDETVRLVLQKDENERQYYADYINKIKDMASPDPAYVLGRINDFIKARKFEQAAIKFAELTQQGEFARAENLMTETFRSGIVSTDLGLDYLNNTSLPLREDPDSNKFLMTTGIKPLDRVIGGFKRGQLICWMGGYKGKKSWACCHTGRVALMHGLTVVHVSHEMTTEEIETRYDMMFGGLSSEANPAPLTLTVYEDKKFKEITIQPDSINNWEKVKQARANIKRFGGRLFIKKYPMGLVNMREIESYLHHLEMNGIYADVLINDYADIMAPLDTRKELRHQLNETYIYHKRLADERNMLVITASQVPNSAVRSPHISIKDFAEDRRKAGNVDMALAICQTEEQEEDNIAVIMVVANRSGPQGYRCMVGAVPAIGQLALFAAPIKKEK